MPSTFTSSLRLEKIATGEQNGTWGATTNRNLEIVLEKAIAGLANIVVPDADYTLSVVNGGDDEARCATLVVSGTLTAERRIYVPGVAKQYAVRNATTGGFGVQVRTATGSPVTVPAGRTLYLFCDGIDCFDVKPLFLSADIISALGYVPYDAANPSGFITIASLAPYAPVQSPVFVGTPTAPTASGGTSNSQIATTAFVQAAVAASTTGVSSFNGRTGAVTLATGDVTTALGFSPYNSSNPSGYVTAATAPVTSVFGRTGAVSMNSADVTTALGYTPYNSTNPSGFITSGALSPYLTSATAAATYAALSGATFSGYVSAPVYYINSSRTLKQDIVPVANGALERVLSWDIKEYAYRARPEQRAIGLIAEDADPRISNGQTIDITAAVFELAQALKEAVHGHRI